MDQINQLGGKVSHFADMNYWLSLGEGLLPILYGIILLIVAHWVAKLLRNLVKKGMYAIKLDEHINRLLNGNVAIDLTTPIAKLVYYIVFLFFLPGIFQQFGLTSLLTPIQGMISDIVGYVPNLLSGAIVGGLFYILATVLRDVIGSVSQGLGLDHLMRKIGIKEGTVDVSTIASTIVFWVVMVAGIAEVAQSLNLSVVADAVYNILSLVGNVLLGAIIIGFGLFAGRTAKDILEKSGSNKAVTQVAFLGIVFIVGTIGLQQMGIGTDIINVAFSLLLGALALGVALGIELGAKDTLGKLVEEFVGSFKK